jgi:SAM-dependent methyltransferase
VKHRLPARYDRPPASLFAAEISSVLRPDLSILDVGSGRDPALAPGRRPPGTRYVGLDVSGAELARAPAGSYDEVLAADVAERVPGLAGAFDLALSSQAFEHVRHLNRAMANIREYLREGGRLVALLSGRFSVNAVLNGALPAGVAGRLMRLLLDRDPETVFAAYYDRCYASALAELMRPWSEAAVTPLFQGGAYFNFALPARSAYLAYENWAARSGRVNLATHYLIVSKR